VRRNLTKAGNRKIIVFTAFTDAANYLYEKIAGRAKDTPRIYST